MISEPGAPEIHRVGNGSERRGVFGSEEGAEEDQDRQLDEAVVAEEPEPDGGEAAGGGGRR
jgi:hypothetical protein